MKVKELVELLAKCDQDSQVVCADAQEKEEGEEVSTSDILSVSESTEDETKVKETQIWFEG